MKVNFLISLLTIFVCHVSAQKLPNVQEKSLRAPAAIKIDGKATEWGDQFQAYNRATGIYYTISNDSNNLYLTIQARDHDNIVYNAVSGGITFTINETADTKNRDIIAVTYPLSENKFGPYLLNFNNEPIEDFSNSKNKLIKEQFTTLKVKSIRTISDSILSIYNVAGIKAASFFDNQMYYTYELSIPLNYLELHEELKKFSYNIRLNGLINGNYKLVRGGDIMVYQKNDGSNITVGYVTPEIKAIFYPTDFSGEYTLAK